MEELFNQLNNLLLKMSDEEAKHFNEVEYSKIWQHAIESGDLTGEELAHLINTGVMRRQTVMSK